MSIGKQVIEELRRRRIPGNLTYGERKRIRRVETIEQLNAFALEHGLPVEQPAGTVAEFVDQLEAGDRSSRALTVALVLDQLLMPVIMGIPTLFSMLDDVGRSVRRARRDGKNEDNEA
jgi:hypothetical protein